MYGLAAHGIEDMIFQLFQKNIIRSGVGKPFCKLDGKEILAQTLVAKTQVKSILFFGSVSSLGSLGLLWASLGFTGPPCMGHSWPSPEPALVSQCHT